MRIYELSVSLNDDQSEYECANHICSGVTQRVYCMARGLKRAWSDLTGGHSMYDKCGKVMCLPEVIGWDLMRPS
jgi:hypothetical protein